MGKGNAYQMLRVGQKRRRTHREVEADREEKRLREVEQHKVRRCALEHLPGASAPAVRVSSINGP